MSSPEHSLPVAGSSDLTLFFRLLKLGVPLNAFFFWHAWRAGESGLDPRFVWPAMIFFGVSAWRCAFPNRYEGNVVVHDTLLSSAFVTRVISTASEVAYIFLFAWMLVAIDASERPVVFGLAVAMVVAVVVSQGFVWAAILTDRFRLFVFEETGWWLLFAAHTVACVLLLASPDTAPAAQGLLVFGVAFGLGYLPWQGFHLRALAREARIQERTAPAGAAPLRPALRRSIRRTLFERRRSLVRDDWGGTIGLTWMAAYWALVIPVWVHAVVRVAAGL